MEVDRYGFRKPANNTKAGTSKNIAPSFKPNESAAADVLARKKKAARLEKIRRENDNRTR